MEEKEKSVKIKEEEFLSLLGQRYEEVEKEKIEELKDMKAPEGLDIWVEKFCREKVDEEEAVTRSDEVISLREEEKRKRVLHRKPRNRVLVFLQKVAVVAIIFIGVGIVGAAIDAEAFYFSW